MNIIETYTKVRQHSEGLCRPLNVEDYVVQIVSFASPAKWHLAHITWFFETFILKDYVENYVEFNPNYSFLFNSYYNTIGDRVLRTNRGNLTRPTVEEIYEYRKHVDKHMLQLLTHNSDESVTELVTLGLNHEQQHQELILTDVKYMFGHNPLFPAYDTEFYLVNGKNTSEELISINGGIYEIGHKETSFCFDNELNVHQVYINDFEICNVLVTNKEFIEFIDDGGYEDFNLWLDEGWAWVQSSKTNTPLYWHKINGVWHYYTLSGLKQVDPDAILTHINFYEANAFANWKGMRLATEFEWEIAADKLDWGKRWEWTNSAYLPYPKYEKAEGAVGEYNGKFMSNKMVLRGASVATSENHSRKTYRNFFHTEERWQFTGIRLVK